MRCRFYIPYILIGLLLFTFVGCKMFTGYSSDRCIVESQEYVVADSAIIDTHGSGKLNLYTTVQLNVPVVDAKDEKYGTLYNVYCDFILDSDTSVVYSPEELPRQVISYLQNRYIDVVEVYHDGDSVASNTKNIIIINYKMKSDITYNDCGVISLLKQIETDIHGGDSLLESSYLNYDIAHGKIIDNISLFGEDNQDAIVSMLRQELMDKNDARTEQQLIDLGFFNLDNMSLSNNFTFTSSGIMWEYRPLELGCFALGYVDIELSYDDLAPYVVSEEIDLSKFN